MYAFARRLVFRPSLAKGYSKPGSVKIAFGGQRLARASHSLGPLRTHAPQQGYTGLPFKQLHRPKHRCCADRYRPVVVTRRTVRPCAAGRQAFDSGSPA
jgi:hypothetical protein